MGKGKDTEKAAQRKEAARRFLEQNKNTAPKDPNLKFQQMPTIRDSKRGKGAEHPRINLAVDVARTSGVQLLASPQLPDLGPEIGPLVIGPNPVVLDTNVLTRAMFDFGESDKHRVVGLAVNGLLTVYVTPPIIQEMRHTINKLSPHPRATNTGVVLGLLEKAVQVPSTGYIQGREVADDDATDSKFIKLLKFLRRKTEKVLLLSSDQHLLKQAKRWPHLRDHILTPSNFLDLWNQRKLDQK
jgi:predicted nucleic acid-binding protein